MKKTLALLAAPAVLLAASAVMAENHWGVTPYVGADAEWRHMNFQKDFGQNLFKHDYPQGNVYVGVQFNEYLAVEGGYEATERKTRTAANVGSTVLTGIRLAAGNSIQSNSTGQVKGLHANILGFLPICEAYRLKLIGLVGFARLKGNFARTDVTINGVATLPDEMPAFTNTFKKRKSVLRLGAGLQHMINCNWGVRAMVKWENSKKLTITSVEDTDFILKAKNSFIYSIGAFYTFN